MTPVSPGSVFVDDGGRMHLIGARFDTHEAAAAAQDELRARLEVPAGDVGVRPLGSTRYDAPTTAYLLAGSFEEHHVDAVLATVERNGGRVITRRIDSRPPLWAGSPGPAARQRPSAARAAMRRGRTEPVSR